MPRPKRPNPSISPQQVLAAPDFPLLLRLKMDQQGVTLENLARMLGVGQTHLRAFLNRTEPVNFRWPSDLIERLQHNPALQFTPSESQKLVQCNEQLPLPRQRLADPAVTSDHLLAANSLDDFLVLKVRQQGIPLQCLRDMAGVSEATLQAARRGDENARQLADAAIEGLGSGLALSAAESAHLTQLNARVPAAQNHHSSFHHRNQRAAVGEVTDALSDQLFLGYYRAHPEVYVLPTPAMLSALDEGDAPRFNHERAVQRQDEDQLLYLRGFSRHGGKRLENVAGFDLSNADVTDVQWAPTLRCDGVQLQGAELLKGRESSVAWRQYHALPIALTSAYKAQNSGFSENRWKPQTRVEAREASVVKLVGRPEERARE